MTENISYGSGAVYYVTDNMSSVQKLKDGAWVYVSRNYGSYASNYQSIYDAGEYRYEMQVRIDGENGKYYKLADPLSSCLINGVSSLPSWGYNVYDTSSYAFVYYKFTIGKDVSIPSANLAYTSATYTGAALKPTVTVINDSGATLIAGVDYDVTYGNNVRTGTATVTITGKGSYQFAISKTFMITPQTLSSKRASLSYTTVTYSGKAKKPTVTVKNAAGATLVNGVDYTVAYSSNTRVGKATVTIKGKGNYSGTLTKTFKIVPKKSYLRSVTPGYRKLTLAMTYSAKSRTGQSGSYYQIAYKMRGKTTWKYFNTSLQKKAIKGLSKGKRYYVKVRAYKTVNKVRYYGAWCTTKLSSKVR